MQKLQNHLHKSRSSGLLLLLILVGLLGLPAFAPTVPAASAQSNRADMAAYLWLSPAGDPRSNVVEPGEILNLDVQVENAGSGDASDVVVYLPYDRDHYVLTSNDNITGIGEDEFWIFIADILPPNSFEMRSVALRVRNSLPTGTAIRLEAEYTWDDGRRTREGSSDEAVVWVGYRDTADDGDSDGGTVRVTNPDITEDTTPPDSCMLSIQREGNRDSYIVTWGGSDSGSGIDSYDVEVKELPNGLWRNWAVDTEDTSAIFGPTEGHNFGFRVRARDEAGNEEAWPASVQINTSQADLVRTECPGSGAVDAI